jgi:hypothetical protein
VKFLSDYELLTKQGFFKKSKLGFYLPEIPINIEYQLISVCPSEKKKFKME